LWRVGRDGDGKKAFCVARTVSSRGSGEMSGCLCVGAQKCNLIIDGTITEGYEPCAEETLSRRVYPELWH
ncbi:MAG: hypothetical protein N2512_14520, partial [Armatimonadetes bacterium]|nr:hypothetical protein [Armatimonadota bacterium]